MSAFVLFLAIAIAFSEYYFCFKGMREQRKKIESSFLRHELVRHP